MVRKSLVLSMAGLIMCAGLAGCSSDREKATDKMIGLVNEFADDLAKIKSNTDLVSAKPDLETLGAKMKDLSNEVQKLPAPTAEEQTALDKKYKPDEEKAEARVEDEMKRLQKDVDPSAPFTIGEAMHMDGMSNPFASAPKMPK